MLCPAVDPRTANSRAPESHRHRGRCLFGGIALRDVGTHCRHGSPAASAARRLRTRCSVSWLSPCPTTIAHRPPTAGITVATTGLLFVNLHSLAPDPHISRRRRRADSLLVSQEREYRRGTRSFSDRAVCDKRRFPITYTASSCRRSSVVEQRFRKPLAGSSNLPVGSTFRIRNRRPEVSGLGRRTTKVPPFIAIHSQNRSLLGPEPTLSNWSQ